MVSPPIPPPPQQQQRRWRHAHERVTSFSAPSEVIRVPARAPSHRHRHHHRFSHVLILPGNPGCSAFYAPFAEALSDELGGETEVVALSFYGHETLTPKKRQKKREGPLSLDGQVAHAAAFLEKLLSEVEQGGGGDEGGRGPSVAVVGHSIGGTVAALAVREVEERRRRERNGRERGRRRAEDAPPSPPAKPPSPLPPPLPLPSEARIAAVCAMMPYVAFDEGSRQQRALRLLAATPPARAAACFAARAAGALLPRAALSALVGLATAASSPPLTRHARETVADFARSGGLGHALFLADTEFRALAISSAAPQGAGKEKEKLEEDKGKGKGKGGSSEFKFSVASASEIWEPLASLGRRASVFAVGRGEGGGAGGGGGEDGGGGGSDGSGRRAKGKGQGPGGGGGGGGAGGDHWCPPHHLDLLGPRAPLASVLLDPGQRHDFVACGGDGTARAARAVAGLLRETARAAAAAAAGEEGEGRGES